MPAHVAGALVLTKPRVAGYVVMAWLIAIALQLIVWGRFPAARWGAQSD